MRSNGLVFRGIVGLVAVLCCATTFAGSFFPFYDDVETDRGSLFAVRPFYSHAVFEEGEVRDVFWPLYTRKSFKDEQMSRGLIFWYTHTFNTQEDSLRYRNWLLPFYFQGRDVCGEPYFALFPFGGTIHEFLGRDEIWFALFPLFGKSRINDLQTTSVLWPIYSHTRGEGVRRDRVFPLVGRSVREGQFDKQFVLWPFWTSAEYFYPGNSGKSWILFPLYGHTKLEQEETTWVLPPFFRFTKGEKENRMLCPWPFVQEVESESRNKLYIWPLWGVNNAVDGAWQRTFLCWPLLWSERAEDQGLVTLTKRVVPFVRTRRTIQREEGVPEAESLEVSHEWAVWPLMSRQCAGENSRFRVLDLWPVRNSAPVERNWAPLWTLYQRTAQQGVVSKDVLWFAWHSEKEPAADRAEWSLLKGLLAYKRDGASSNVRFLYFMRFGEIE